MKTFANTLYILTGPSSQQRTSDTFMPPLPAGAGMGVPIGQSNTPPTLASTSVKPPPRRPSGSPAAPNTPVTNFMAGYSEYQRLSSSSPAPSPSQYINLQPATTRVSTCTSTSTSTGAVDTTQAQSEGEAQVIVNVTKLSYEQTDVIKITGTPVVLSRQNSQDSSQGSDTKDK